MNKLASTASERTGDIGEGCLALVPTVLIAVRQTTTIKASMIAYSTAVGPLSSRIRHRSCFQDGNIVIYSGPFFGELAESSVGQETASRLGSDGIILNATDGLILSVEGLSSIQPDGRIFPLYVSDAEPR